MSGFVHAIMISGEKDSNGNVFSYLSSFVKYKSPKSSRKGVFWLAIPRGRDNFGYVICSFQNKERRNYI